MRGRSLLCENEMHFLLGIEHMIHDEIRRSN